MSQLLTLLILPCSYFWNFAWWGMGSKIEDQWNVKVYLKNWWYGDGDVIYKCPLTIGFEKVVRTRFRVTSEIWKLLRSNEVDWSKFEIYTLSFYVTSFGRSKMVLVCINWFGHGHNDLVTIKMKWSSPNQFGQTKTIWDQPKLFWSHSRTRHYMPKFMLLVQ